MQNAGMAALGLDWRYLAFDVHPENLREAVAGAQAMKFIGLNLTLPHKLLAVDLVDELDESARMWGAVNTIRFEARDPDGAPEWKPLREFTASRSTDLRTRGFNTDADALVRSLREDLGCNLSGATVLLLGVGGAGRVAALKLAAEKVKHLYLVNRTLEKAVEMQAEIGRRFPEVTVNLGYPEGVVDLILNATSLGLKPEDALPFDETRFRLSAAGLAYDMVYRPAETRFLRTAQSAGCRIANGLGMLLYQGTKALEIWTGQPAPVEIMRRALEDHIYGPSHQP